MEHPPDWVQFAPTFDELETRPLTLAHVGNWLQDWSEAEKEFRETGLALSRAHNENTRDKGAEAAYLTFVREVTPFFTRVENRLRRRLLNLDGFMPESDQERVLLRFRNASDLYHEANVALLSEHAALSSQYTKLKGGLTAELDGKRLTLPQAQKFLLEADRSVRERSYNAVWAARLSISDALDSLFIKLIAVRRALAQNADLSDYRMYRWHELGRVDYTPEDNLRLHRAILAGTVPWIRVLHEERRKALDLRDLRPWDMDIEPYGGQPLKPFETTVELEEGVERMLGHLDVEWAEQFHSLRGGWLDLDSREGKVPGLGYHAFFPKSRKSFIFMSASGTHNDVLTLCHEVGHAFHALAASAKHELLWNRFPGSEFGEVASQAMELLVLPYLSRENGGFYTPEDTVRAKRKTLDRIIFNLPSLALRDAFQHWLYTETGADLTVQELDAKWLELSDQFMPGVDWRGKESIRAKGWHQLHIFTMPFYMLEYAYAWMGAIQIGQHAQQDLQGTLSRYRNALSMGGTRSIPELYAASGARLLPDEKAVSELMRFVFEQRSL